MVNGYVSQLVLSKANLSNGLSHKLDVINKESHLGRVHLGKVIYIVLN